MLIKEHESGLFVSECGRVFKEASYSTRGGNRFSRHKGYLFVSFAAKRHDVHRLVAQTFLDNPNNHTWVLHGDDVPTNNTVGNLRWGTPKENAADAKKNRKYVRANRLGRRAKTERDVKIWAAALAGQSLTEIANQWRISQSRVSQICAEIQEQLKKN